MDVQVKRLQSWTLTYPIFFKLLALNKGCAATTFKEGLFAYFYFLGGAFLQKDYFFRISTLRIVLTGAADLKSEVYSRRQRLKHMATYKE